MDSLATFALFRLSPLIVQQILFAQLLKSAFNTFCLLKKPIVDSLISIYLFTSEFMSCEDRL